MNDWYKFIKEEFPEQYERMQKFGRRNISTSTVAPTGTVSIMTQTTSGLEPLFLPYYMRRKKINPNDKDSRVDFTDQNGDQWQEFAVLHPKFKDWITVNHIYPKDYTLTKSDLEECFKNSPWFESTANDINWENRVEIQAIIQNYTTNAISSTINLPNNVSKEDVSKIYWRAWELGLKGVTVYRDGCRTGVLVAEGAGTTKEVAFAYKDAIKRPKTLSGEGYTIIVKGVEYIVIIGLFDKKPYEVFASKNIWEVPKHFNCNIIKNGKNKYTIELPEDLTIENFTSDITDEEAIITRLISTSLRHGTDVTHLVDQLSKTHGSLVSFGKAISRILSKYVAVKETGEECPECGGKLRKEEGCKKCDQCGYSACN